MQELHDRLEWMADSDEPLMFDNGSCTLMPGVTLIAGSSDDKLIFKLSNDDEERVLFEWQTRGRLKNVISEFCEEKLKILFEIDSSWFFHLGSCKTFVEGIFDFDLNLICVGPRVLAQ